MKLMLKVGIGVVKLISMPRNTSLQTVLIWNWLGPTISLDRSEPTDHLRSRARRSREASLSSLAFCSA